MPLNNIKDYLSNKNLSLEQSTLLDWFDKSFNYAAAGINRHIVRVEPFSYKQAIAGSEFLTYAATKLYIAFKIGVSSNQTIYTLAPVLDCYNEANAIDYRVFNTSSYWDGTLAAVRYLPNYLEIKNFWFSRIVSNYYLYMYFIGLRVTLD